MEKRVVRGLLVLVFGWAVWGGAPAAEEVREPRSGAEGLIEALGCRGCHEIKGRGGTFGPSLDGIGQRFDRDQMRRKLKNPAAAEENGDSRMPAFDHVGPQDMAILLDFLESL